MKGKPASYVEVVGECSVHGRFQVRRKPNKYRSDAGGAQDGLYCAVKCPVCPFYATIVSQVLVSPDRAKGADSQESMLLPLEVTNA